MKEYYSPYEIHFRRQETLWVIQNYNELRAGQYPPEPSNYIDMPMRTRTYKAPFITAAECYIEISDRLERCGIDGLILLAIECWGESEQSLSKYFSMPEWSIRKRYKRALAYVSSGSARRWHDTPKRKGKTYQEFKRRKK